jgi:hypothetical protein
VDAVASIDFSQKHNHFKNLEHFQTMLESTGAAISITKVSLPSPDPPVDESDVAHDPQVCFPAQYSNRHSL